MTLVDSHTHIYFGENFPNPGETVDRAIEAGVKHMVLPGVNSETIVPIKELHSMFPENTSMAIGLHPTDVTPDKWEKELDAIEKELRDNADDYVAIGETGMDFYWDKSFVDLQRRSFEHQCLLALEIDKPVIIHSRDAFDATYEVLKGLPATPKMVFHSFTGTPQDAQNILSMFPDAMFGINGIVTFKNSSLKDVLKVIPDDRLLLETDSPYLAPVPMRGRTNESSYLPYIASFIANEKSLTVDDIATLTTDNAIRFFRLHV